MTHPYNFSTPSSIVTASAQPTEQTNAEAPPTAPAHSTTTPTPQLAPQIMGHPTSVAKPAYEELLLTDTKKFVETVRNEAAQAVWERDKIKENRRHFMEEFFTENSDLKDYNTEVESILDRRLAEWGNLPVPEAKKKLATEMRGFIDRVRQKVGTKTEEVMTAKASALPSSGEQVKSMGQPAATKETNFVQERRAYKNRNTQRG